MSPFISELWNLWREVDVFLVLTRLDGLSMRYISELDTFSQTVRHSCNCCFSVTLMYGF